MSYQWGGKHSPSEEVTFEADIIEGQSGRTTQPSLAEGCDCLVTLEFDCSRKRSCQSLGDVVLCVTVILSPAAKSSGFSARHHPQGPLSSSSHL